jgi:hypothetical protein
MGHHRMLGRVDQRSRTTRTWHSRLPRTTHRISTLAEARAFVRELQLDRAREAARTAMNEDELRAALRLRDRALGRFCE